MKKLGWVYDLNGYTAGEIASRYRMLRGVTTGRFSSLALIVVFSAILAVLSFLNTHNPLLSTSLLVFIPALYILNNRIVSILYQRRYETFSARRLDSLSVVELLTVSTGFAAYSTLSWLNIERMLASPIFTGLVSLATYLGYSVRRAMGGKVPPSLYSSLSSPIAGFILIYLNTGSLILSAANTVLALAMAVSSMELVRLVLDRKLSFGGVRLFSLGQAFFRSLLAGRSCELEAILGKLSKESQVRNDMFLIRRENGRPISLVITDVHPGPFRDVGSSTYPCLVQREMSASGIEAVVFKGLSSHEKNLASRAEAERLAALLSEKARYILLRGIFSQSLTRPKRMPLNGAKTLWWKLAGRTVCLMTLHPSPMEDLPSEIADGDDDTLIPVDTHNSYDHGYRALDGESLGKLKELVAHLKSNSEACPEELHVGFARIVPHELGLVEGMGPGGLSCLVMGGKKAEVAIVVADSNNAVPWVRDLVMDVASRHGIGEAELCTTDTHCVNAVTLGGRGYHPLGEVIPRQKLEPLIETVITQALSDMSLAKVAYEKVTSRHAVFSDVLESLSNRISAGARAYLTGLAASTGLPALVMLFL